MAGRQKGPSVCDCVEVVVCGFDPGREDLLLKTHGYEEGSEKIDEEK